MVGDVDLAGAEETARVVVHDGGVARVAEVDVSDEEQVERFVSAAVAAHGPLDCAANVAGTHAELGAPTVDVTVDDFDGNLAVNLRGMWLCVRAELRSSDRVRDRWRAGQQRRSGVGRSRAARNPTL